MWKPILLWLCLSGYCLGGPLGSKRNMPIIQRQEEEMDKESTAVASENDANKPEAGDTAPNMLMISTLTLPSNATSIRADITDGFSCANKSYGYYADVENDCQIFHVCLPVTYADGRENTFRWSFICPEETIFSQDSFTCMRREDMTIDCEESFKYYELNRNFGMTEEDENKNVEGSSSGDTSVNSQFVSEDQESAMTTHVEHEKQPQHVQNSQLHLQQEQQLMSNEKPEKVSSPHTSKPVLPTSQKEKPVKVQKPNRRKPSPSTSNISHKKKPTMPLRKATQTTTTSPIIAVTVTSSPNEEETKPPRFTKRPPTMSINLKEKLQPVIQSEPTPVRADLFNQKRKRPSIFNKKDATTIKPAEDLAPTTELIAAEEPTTADSSSVSETVKSTVNLPDVVPEASETNAVTVKPSSNQPSNDLKTGEEKKIAKPQPTEPEAVLPEGTKLEESPVVAPLEAIEEIPAVITEVEEDNSNQKPAELLENAKSDLDGTENTEQILVQVPVENTPAETHVDSPAIFQQNSEENLGSPVVPLVEEMEDQKPQNAPDMMPATSEMEHQDPMIEQMLSETDPEANKQSMGGFKPVDPVMAAEAEALIANFLNTLMKSEKIDNNEPQVPPSDMETNEQEETNQEGSPTTPQEIKSQLPETVALPPETPLSIRPESEQQSPLVEVPTPFPSMMMMMNNHPDEIFQIPVQVIQSPVEEPTLVQNPKEATTLNEGDSVKPEAPRPLSIDDIVELVKDKLDQVPETEAPKGNDEVQNTKASTSEEVIKDEPVAELPQKPSELIIPIYHRVSAEPNGNMIKAHDQTENTQPQEDDFSAGITDSPHISETETNAEANAPTITETKSKTDRALRARNIKTAKKMDPRKRRFLFKSDTR